MRRKPLAALEQHHFRVQPPTPQPTRQQQQNPAAKHLPNLVIAPLPVLRDKLRQQRRPMRRRQFLVQARRIAVSMLEKIPARHAEKNHGQAE